MLYKSGSSRFLIFTFCAGFIVYGAFTLASVKARGVIASPLTPQQSGPQADDTPVYSDFKGVHIGMTAEEARQKLGVPSEKGEEQDFYTITDKNMAQIYYDKLKKVYAVSVTYIGEQNAPAPKAVVGSDLEVGADGAMHKLVRYPKAGFWVSYNRTAGTDPLITVTMQKIQ